MIDVFETHSAARIALLRKAIERNPDTASLVFQLARELAYAGDFDEYEKLVRRCKDFRTPVLAYLGWSPTGDRDVVGRRMIRCARICRDNGGDRSMALAALAIGEALLGHTDAVSDLVDYAEFLRCTTLTPPQGMTLAQFNAALADEVGREAAFMGRESKPGSGSFNYTLRKSQSPVIAALEGAIGSEVERYIAGIQCEPDHPFMAAAPERFELKCWAYICNGEDHLDSHMHEGAWASGVYYVRQPDASRLAETKNGWLRVGPPAKYGVHPDDGWPARLFEPREGTMVLMPGYFFHDTLPVRAEQERISIAFNVIAAAGPRGASD